LRFHCLHSIPLIHCVLADDIPGVADFDSDLDEDDEDEDDEEDGGAEDGDGSGQDVDAQPPPASKKGKSGAQQKAVPKLPPKKGIVLSSALFTKPHSIDCFDLLDVAGSRSRVEIEYETETSSSANFNFNQ
jgi:hypothetical protein